MHQTPPKLLFESPEILKFTVSLYFFTSRLKCVSLELNLKRQGREYVAKITNAHPGP